MSTTRIKIYTFTDDNGVSLFAEVNEEQAGLMGITREHKEGEEHLKIESIRVSAEYRNRGVARALIAELPKHVKNASVLRMDALSSVALRLVRDALNAQPDNLVYHDVRRTWADAPNDIPPTLEISEWGGDQWPVHARWNLTPGLGYFLRHSPLSTRDIYFMRGEKDIMGVVIPINLSDVVGNDFQEWLDYLSQEAFSQKVFGSSELMDVNYTLVGVDLKTQNLHIRVEGRTSLSIEGFDPEIDNGENEK